MVALTLLYVSDCLAGEGEVVPGVADGVGRAGVVQDRCDRKQTLQKQILLVLVEWEWFRIDLIGNKPCKHKYY